MDIRKEFLKSIPIEKATEQALLKVIDEKKARDYLILKDFDYYVKKNRFGVIDIYYLLAEKYEISFNSIRLIVANRASNQL